MGAVFERERGVLLDEDYGHRRLISGRTVKTTSLTTSIGF
jgi:hypothetical protein